MSADLRALAERVVKCSHWRWLPGMLAVDPHPELWRLKDGSTPNRVAERYPDEHAGEGWGSWLPDLVDPCTLGGLLSLVREAWGWPALSAGWSDDGEWRVWADHGVVAFGATEAEALVWALEAAPPREPDHG